MPLLESQLDNNVQPAAQTDGLDNVRQQAYSQESTLNGSKQKIDSAHQISTSNDVLEFDDPYKNTTASFTETKLKTSNPEQNSANQTSTSIENQTANSSAKETSHETSSKQSDVQRAPMQDGGHADWYPDGSCKIYGKDSALLYTRKPEQDGGYSITYPDNSKFMMRADGVVLSSTDPTGRSTHYSWNSEGRLSRVTINDPDSADHMTYLEFGKDGWHRFDRHGNDQGRSTFDINVHGIDGKVVGHKVLSFETLTEWQVSNAGRGQHDRLSEESYRTWRDTTTETLKRAMTDGNRDLVESLCREIGKLDPEKRNDILHKYKHDTGADLPSQLKEHNYQLAHRLLTRDNPTDDTTQARVLESIQRLKEGDKDSAHVLRESLAHLDGKQMEQLKNAKPPISEQLDEMLKSGKISQGTYESCKLYLGSPKDSDARKSPEFYEKLARIALDDNATSSELERLQLLREALATGQQPPVDKAVSEARQRIAADTQTNAKLESAFSRHQLAEAKDLVKTGHVSIFTRIEQNSGILKDNPDNVKRLLTEDLSQEERQSIMRARTLQDNMTSQERIDFLAGKPVTTIGGKPFSEWGDPEKVSADLEFLSHLRQSLKVVAGTMTWLQPGSVTRDLRNWLDLAENGKPTLESKIAQHYADGRGVEGIKEELQNMTPEEWARIKTDESYRKRIKQAIYECSFKNAPAVDEIDKMAKADTYDRALGISISNLPENASPSQVVRSLTNISREEHEKLTGSKELQNKYDQLIQKMPEGAEKEAARSLKERLCSTETDEMTFPPKLTATEQLCIKAHDFANKKISKEEFMSVVANSKDDPQTLVLLQELKNGAQSEQAKLLEGALKKELGADYEKVALPIVKQQLPLSDLVSMNTKTTANPEGPVTSSVNMKEVIAGLKNISPEESQKIVELANQKNQKELQKQLPNLSENQIELVVNVLKNSEFNPNDSRLVLTGRPQPEDMIRSYVVDGNQDSAAVRDMLSHMLPADRIKLQELYAKKYGHNMIEDLQKRSPDGIRPELMRLASPDMAKFEESMQRVDEIDRILRNPFFKEKIASSDSSGGRMGELLQQLARAENEQQRSEIKAKLAGAMTDYQGSAQQFADTVVDGIYIAACVGTAGLGSSQIIALGLIGALAKPGANIAVNGDLYGQRGEHAEQLGRDIAGGAWGFGASGIFAGGLGKAVKVMRGTPEFENKVLELSAKYTTYQMSQIMANVIQQVAEQQIDNQSHVTGIPKYTVVQILEQTALRFPTKLK